ncbi:MAG TPA: inorganic pyrophosphatase [Bacteroidetes bacterium]|nr:inorganic pyrophosphatase [Bacteroidota bacterium]
MFDSISVSNLISSIKTLLSTEQTSYPDRMISVSGFFLFVLVGLLATGCQPEIANEQLLNSLDSELIPDYETLTPYADSLRSVVQVVVEIPVGSNDKIEFNKQSLLFELDRTIAYLPYPINYGFIPGTLSDASSGGDGDPADVLLLSTRVPTGTVMAGYAVATLKLIDRGEEDVKVLVIPVDSTLRVLPCDSWECITSSYPQVPNLIEDWFLSYKGTNITISEGWANTEETILIIQRHIP